MVARVPRRPAQMLVEMHKQKIIIMVLLDKKINLCNRTGEGLRRDNIRRAGSGAERSGGACLRPSWGPDDSLPDTLLRGREGNENTRKGPLPLAGPFPANLPIEAPPGCLPFGLDC